MKVTESTVEDAAVSRLEQLRYSILHGPDIAPDTLCAERELYANIVLVDSHQNAGHYRRRDG